LHVNVLEVITDRKELEHIQNELRNRNTIKKTKLYSIVERLYPNLKENTFRKIIFELRKKNILHPVKRGLYTLEKKQIYNPDISGKLKRISSSIQKEKVTDNYCIWETFWANEFMIHQPMRSVIVAEVDSDALETVYYLLKDKVYKRTYIKPDEQIMKQYVMEDIEPIILLPFKSRSPVINNSKITIPKLEKILVDLYFDSKLFYWIRGDELTNIFNEAHRKYYLNFSTLLSYARGRRADKNLKQFLINNTDITPELFI